MLDLNALTDPEMRLWKAIKGHVPLDLGPEGSDHDRDPQNGAGWGPERTIRAEVLTELLTSPELPEGCLPHAVDLRFALIRGVLDLEARDVLHQLDLYACYLDQPIRLYEARTHRISFVGCVLPKLAAGQIQTRGNVILADCQAEQVDLRWAVIGGLLVLNGTHLKNSDGSALACEGVHIDSGMLCANGFQVDGEMRMRDAQIRGPLVLRGAHLRNPEKPALVCDGVRIDGGIFGTDGFELDGEFRFHDAEVNGPLDLRGAHLTNAKRPALIGDRARVNSGVFCSDGFRAEGGLRLSGIRITGPLSLNGAHLSNTDGPALSCEGAQIKGGLFCAQGFTAEGELLLRAAHIGAQLALAGAHLKNDDGPVFTGDGAQIGGDMVCSGSSTDGEFRLRSAHISGQLVLAGAHLKNDDGPVFTGDGAQIGGDMICSAGFKAEGEMRLVGVHIGGQLALDGAHLKNDSGRALTGDGALIDGGIFCTEGFEAGGELRLLGARIAGPLDLSGAGLNHWDGLAIDLEQATIAHLRLPAKIGPLGILDFTDARVGRLDDNWPHTKYSARMRGLVYDTINPFPDDVEERLRWLASAADGYLPQPYQQLAKVLRDGGRDDAARRVVIAKERERRRKLSKVGKVWSDLLYVTVGYGYQAWRGLLWLAAFILTGWGVFAWAEAHGHMGSLVQKGHHLPQFHAWLYSLDSVLPVVNLGQKSYWSPTGVAQYWHTASVLAGWLLATLLLAAVTTKLVRD